MLGNLDLILQSEGGEDSVGKHAFDTHALDKHQRQGGRTFSNGVNCPLLIDPTKFSAC